MWGQTGHNKLSYVKGSQLGIILLPCGPVLKGICCKNLKKRKKEKKKVTEYIPSRSVQQIILTFVSAVLCYIDDQ